MNALAQELPHGDVEAKLFPDLALQAFFRGLARPDFAAGELPHPRLAGPGLAAGDQHPARLRQYGCRDVDHPPTTPRAQLITGRSRGGDSFSSSG